MKLVFTDDVTADRSRKMDSEVYRAILSAHIQPNAKKLKGKRFAVQMDNDSKRNAKPILRPKEWLRDLNPKQHDFELLKTKLSKDFDYTLTTF